MNVVYPLLTFIVLGLVGCCERSEMPTGSFMQALLDNPVSVFQNSSGGTVSYTLNDIETIETEDQAIDTGNNWCPAYLKSKILHYNFTPTGFALEYRQLHNSLIVGPAKFDLRSAYGPDTTVVLSNSLSIEDCKHIIDTDSSNKTHHLLFSRQYGLVVLSGDNYRWERVLN